MISWGIITQRRDARPLQAFTCTTPVPRTPGGRNLPHPKTWEWEVQSFLRRTSQDLRPGQELLVGSDPDIVACACFEFSTSTGIAEVFLASGAVAVSRRGQGGALADELFSRVIAECVSRTRDQGYDTLVVTGKIHNDNLPSQNWASRAGLEPQGVPDVNYQLWLLYVSVEP